MIKSEIILSNAPKEFLITLKIATVSGKTLTSLTIRTTLIILNMVSKSEFSNKSSGINETKINAKSIRFQMLVKKDATELLAIHRNIISIIKRMIHIS